MRLSARHSCTGERWRDMDVETLRKVMRRTHRFAADSAADQRAAQAELQRRKAAAKPRG